MIHTERLELRLWHDDDLAAFAALNADPEVMRFMPNMLTRDQSDAVLQRFEQHHIQYGYGVWAATLRSTGEWIGAVGLNHPMLVAHFTPCVEVLWRIARKHWNQGYATESAQAVLDFGFHTLKLQEIVAYTTVPNTPSRRVMEKLGMTHDPVDDFQHPNLPEDHPLRTHVLYRAKWD